MKQDAPISEVQADAAASKGDAEAACRLLRAAVQEAPGRFESWIKLSMISRAIGDFEGALEAISGALRIAPLDFTALLTKASLLDLSGQKQAAEIVYGHALAQRPQAENVPPFLKPAVEQAEARYAAYQARLLERLREAGRPPSGASAAERQRLQRFCTNIARTTATYHSEPTHFQYPGLPEFEFHAREHFPWIEALEAATPEIRADYERVAAADASMREPYVQYPEDVPLNQWRDLNRSEDWTAIHLLRSGVPVKENAQHCLATMKALEAIPQPVVPGRSPNAMFSMLAPRTRIPPHTGVANTRLVVHLPLIVPPNCAFRVGAETREWKAGEAWVFDDTIEHEAWNDSDEVRVILIFDVWHWALSGNERDAVAAIMPASDVDSSTGL